MMIRAKHILSVAAALVTPWLLEAAIGPFPGFVFGAAAHNGGRRFTMIVGLLFAVGVSLWGGIDSFVYGACLPPAFVLCIAVLARSSNSLVSGIVISLLIGIALGMGAMACGVLKRRQNV